jgi:hypothetical protein
MTSQQKVNQVSTSVEIVIPTPVGNTTALAEIIPTMVGNTPVSTGNNTAATLCQLTPDAVSDLSCDNSSADEKVKEEQLANKKKKKARKEAKAVKAVEKKAAQEISPQVSPITVVIKDEQKPASQEPTVQAAPAPAPAPEPKTLDSFPNKAPTEKKKAPTDKTSTKSVWATKPVSKVPEMKLLMDKKTELEAKLENANCALLKAVKEAKEAEEAEEEDEESENVFNANKLVIQLKIDLATLTNTILDIKRLKLIKSIKQKNQMYEMEQTLAILNETVADKKKRLASKDLSQLYCENKTSAPAPATPAEKPSAKPAPPTKKEKVQTEKYKTVGKDGKIIPNADEKKTPLVERAEAFVEGLLKKASQHGKFSYNSCKGKNKTGNDWSNLATANFPSLLKNPLKMDEKEKDELFQQVCAVAQAMATSDVYVGMWPHPGWFTLLLDRGYQKKLVWQFAARFSLPTGPQWEVLMTSGHKAPNGAGQYQVLATDNNLNTLVNKFCKNTKKWNSEHIASLRGHVEDGTFCFIKLENGEPMTVEEFNSWYLKIPLASAAK